MKLTTFNSQFDTDSAGPGRGSATVVPDDGAEFGFTEDDVEAVARRLVVFGEGTVHFLGADNEEDTWTFTSDMSYPVEIPVAVKRVYEDSSVAAGNIKAIW